MKSNALFEETETIEVTEAGVREDTLIRLASTRGKEQRSQQLRRIRFIREDDGKELIFITNDLKRTADAVAALYKQRWQIELFFKWIKQNLKIKTSFGTSENAVKVQIIIAMITYLLLHIASRIIPNNRSMQQLARLMTTNIMQRRNFLELLIEKEPPGKPKSADSHRQMTLIHA